MKDISNLDILDYVPNAVSIISGKNVDQILYVNKAWEVLTGYNKEDLKNFDPISLVHQDMKELIKKRGLVRMNDNGKQEVSRYNLKLVKKDGSLIWIDYNVTEILYLGQKALLNISVDIIGPEFYKRKIEESEEQFRKTFHINPDPICITRMSDGVYVDINQGYTRVTGYTREDLLNESASKLNHWINPEDLGRFDKLLIKNGKVENLEVQFRKKDGTIGIGLVSAKIINSNGEKHIISITREITEFRKSQDKLKQSEVQYRKLISQSPDAIFVQYKNKFELINEQFYLMFGYTIEELNADGFNYLSLVAPKDLELLLEWQKQLADGKTFGMKQEFTGVTKDGKEIEIEASIVLVAYKEELAIQGILRDITKHKRLELQLQQAQKMEAIGLLAGGVAHDFNNLLTVINGFSEIILEMDIPKKITAPLQQIRNAGERAKRLTEQLLAFSRKQIIKPIVLDLNKAISNQMKMLGRLLGENIEIVTILHTKAIKINADLGQLDQILMNLTINARDAMPFGGKIIIETGVKKFDENYVNTHLNTKTGTFAMLAISDNGQGIDKQTISHIFEPFFTTKGLGKGTGLGLATVYGIVKQNQGFIYVYSEENQGTTFKIYLPLIEEKITETRLKQEDIKLLKGEETILIVEDDPSVRSVTEFTLLDYGYRVISASNGEEGYQKFTEHSDKINLLLTDVIMPLMSGKDLANKLKQEKPELKVIFFSGYTDNSIVHHGVLDEGVEFVQKPFAPKELVRKIREVLDS